MTLTADQARHGDRAGRRRHGDPQRRRHRRRCRLRSPAPARSRSSGAATARDVPVSVGPGVDTDPARDQRARHARVPLPLEPTAGARSACPPQPASTAQVSPLPRDPGRRPARRPGAERRTHLHDGHRRRRRAVAGRLDRDGRAGARRRHLPAQARRAAPVRRRAGARRRHPRHLQLPREPARGGRVQRRFARAARGSTSTPPSQVDPSGATALADAHATGKTRSTARPASRPKTAKRPTQTINDKINCKVAKQIPRVPTLIAGDRAARSISLHLGLHEARPVRLLSVDVRRRHQGAHLRMRPSPPHGQVRVHGQNGVTLTQLFPATEYELTVTAYINLEHTTSAPILVTTGPEGPAAPTDVRATTDSSGNWTVSWNSCGGVAQGCVPSASWNLIPSFCDGRGLSNVPAKVTVAGDPTQHSFTHVYEGSDALLGRGMCFAVQGVGTEGTIGTTSAPSAAGLQLDDPEHRGADARRRRSPRAPRSAARRPPPSTSTSAPIRCATSAASARRSRCGCPGPAPRSRRRSSGTAGSTASRRRSPASARARSTPPPRPSPRRGTRPRVASKGPVTVTTRANWPVDHGVRVVPDRRRRGRR